ncbi:MAG: hypothetical protein JRN52_04605 [Nitrososphaerota archaeon]|nr:hypothetical protein [Nitrososphaerota archaeon]
MEEKTVNIGSHKIGIRELTTEDESRIRVASQVWNSKKKIWEIDRANLDATYLAYSVVPETWPKEWGPLTSENIRKLPAKLTRKLFVECNRLNTLGEDASDFLDRPQSFQEKTQETPSSTL